MKDHIWTLDETRSLPHTCVMNNHGSLKYGLTCLYYIHVHGSSWVMTNPGSMKYGLICCAKCYTRSYRLVLLCTNLKSQKEITCESLKFWKSPACCHHSGGLCMRWTPTETLPTASVPFSLSSFSVSCNLQHIMNWPYALLISKECPKQARKTVLPD